MIARGLQRLGWLILLLSLVLPGLAAATTYWVSATLGSDAGTNCQAAAGGTPPGPYLRTIQRGVTCATAAGDIVNVRAGTYTETVSSWPASGTLGNPIIIQGYTGETATWTSPSTTANTWTEGAIYLVDREYIRVQNFRFANSYPVVTIFVLNCHGTQSRDVDPQRGIEFLNNTFLNNGNTVAGTGGTLYFLDVGQLSDPGAPTSKINGNTFTNNKQTNISLFGTSDVQVQGNIGTGQIPSPEPSNWPFHQTAFLRAGRQDSSACSSAGSQYAERILVEGNTWGNVANDGSGIEHDVAGVRYDTDARYSIIRDNTFHDLGNAEENNGFFGVYLEAHVNHNQVYRNTFYNIGTACMADGRTGATASDNIWRNNTAYQCGKVGFLASDTSNLTFENNLIYGTNGKAKVIAEQSAVTNGGHTWRNNLYDDPTQANIGAWNWTTGSQGWPPSGSLISLSAWNSASGETGSQRTDPLLAAVGSADFRLCTAAGTPVAGCTGASPAIDAGVDVGLPYNDTAPDQGAHETGAPASCSSPTAGSPYPASTAILCVTPDPASYEQHGAGPNGADLWVMTTGSDDNVYALWGDGSGWDTTGYDYFGTSQISGDPGSLSGTDIYATSALNYKPLGIVADAGNDIVGFYNSANDSPAWDYSRVLTSSTLGTSWTFTGTSVFRMSVDGVTSLGLLQFGAGYTGLPAHVNSAYYYVYLGIPHQEPTAASPNIYLARVPKASLASRAAYTYYNGLDGAGQPIWSSDFAQKTPILSDANGEEFQIGVTWFPAWDRFLLVKGQTGSGCDVVGGTTSGCHLGMFESPNPWGPWFTLYYGAFQGTTWKFSYQTPQPWMATDGSSFWLTWSGDRPVGGTDYDNLNLIRFDVTLSSDTTAPAAPTALTATPLSITQMQLDWTPPADGDVVEYWLQWCTFSGCQPSGTGLHFSAPASPTYIQSSLSPGTTYWYTLKAIDSSANISEASALATATTPSLGWLARWPMDEGSGATVGDSAGSNDGEICDGATCPHASPVWVTGRVGAGAVSLDGTNDLIRITDAAVLNIAAQQDFTLMAWVKTSQAGAVGAWPKVIDKTQGGTYGYALVLHDEDGQSGHWYAQLFNGAATPALYSTIDIADGAWHHITLVRSGTTLYTYTDGANQTTATDDVYDDSLSHATADDLTLGGTSALDSCCFLDGQIDDVRLYNGALSAAQVASVFSGEATLATSHWRWHAFSKGDGTEWLAREDEARTIRQAGKIRLRMGVQNTGAEPATQPYPLQCKIGTGGSYTPVSGNCAAPSICLTPDPALANGALLTPALTVPGGLSAGTDAAKFADSPTPWPSITLNTDEVGEIEYSLAVNGLASGEIICCRPVQGDLTVLPSYPPGDACLTVNTGALNFGL